jgi:hypothetical protein
MTVEHSRPDISHSDIEISKVADGATDGQLEVLMHKIK